MYFGPINEETVDAERKDAKEKKDVKEKKESKTREKKDVGTMVKEFGLQKLILVMICGIAIIVLTFPSFFTPKSTDKKSSTDTSGNSTDSTYSENNGTTQEYTCQMENRLKQILIQVKDIGQVEVMITLKSSKELVPFKDQTSEEQTTKEQDGAGGSRDSNSVSMQDKTVLTESETGGSEPIIVKEIEPEVEGVVVICQGGDNAFVQSEVTDAVLALFNVSANKVKVMKMN